MQKASGIGSTVPSDNTVVRMPVTPLYSSLEKRRERWKQQKERRKTRQNRREREIVFACVQRDRQEQKISSSSLSEYPLDLPFWW